MQFLQYLFVKALFTFLNAISLKTGKRIAHILAWILLHLVKYRKRVVLENLRRVYGDDLPREKNRMLKDIYRHFMYLWLEFLQASAKRREEMLQSCTFHNLEYVDEVLKQGKGLILITGHLGNFEWFAYVLALQGYKIFGVAKKQRNRYVNAMIHDSRRQFGTEIIYTRNAMTEGADILSENHILGLVADQDAKHRGIFVDFLGIPSSTAAGPAVFHLRTGAPIINCAAIRQDYAKFDVYFEPPYTSDRSEVNDHTVKSITQFHVNALERWVRQYPEQWFWTHRRWKTRPQTKS